MYAMIRRHNLNADGADDLQDAGERFGAALSRVRGFIAAITMDDIGGTPLTIALFEDQASLANAEDVARRWVAAAQCDQVGLETAVLSRAEVVAQKGL